MSESSRDEEGCSTAVHPPNELSLKRVKATLLPLIALRLWNSLQMCKTVNLLSDDLKLC